MCSNVSPISVPAHRPHVPTLEWLCLAVESCGTLCLLWTLSVFRHPWRHTRKAGWVLVPPWTELTATIDSNLTDLSSQEEMLSILRPGGWQMLVRQ